MEITKLTVKTDSGERIDFSIEGDVMVSLTNAMPNEALISKYEVEKAYTIAQFIFNSKF